jgi:hypothetical protein
VSKVQRIGGSSKRGIKQKVVTFQFECYTSILVNDFHFHGSQENNLKVHPKFTPKRRW